MATDFAKAYNPKIVEGKIYQLWERSGFFDPDRLSSKPYAPSPKPSTQLEARRHRRLPRQRRGPLMGFTIIMPPPNANGPLHIGHAVFVTLQDIMIRFWRMRGRKTLWLPGADHAGFETQVVFDRKLEKQGRRRSDIPRDELYRQMLEFTLENKKVMESQLRKLGASCDWSREKFTLDPEIVKIVADTFVKLYQDGLLYRGERIVNWCVKHQTTLSDLEIKYEERQDPLYYIKYGPLTLATVRPETKFGDTAVAVHPSDKRYRQYVGKEIEIETLIGPAKIKIITDEAVDPKFGTGVIKVTPGHDPADFEIGKRHNLEIRQVIDKDGRLNEKTGPYTGLKVMEARLRVSEDMKKAGLLIKVEPDYKHNVSVCYKCETAVEPLVMPQWFIRMTAPPHAKTLNPKPETLNPRKKSLRDMAVEAVKSGKIRIIPRRYEKVFFHWMKNLRDWNISRQIVWGIRIPVWYCRGFLPEGAKKMGFAGDIVQQVFGGKVRTYRLRDHEFKIGDKVFFENSAIGTIFGYGVITEAKKTTVGGIGLPDSLHGGKYKTHDELIRAFKRHYPAKTITKDTAAWIYTYEFKRDSSSGCGEIIVSSRPPIHCSKCGAKNLIQDPDVLDTWFSSGQWPFATLLAQHPNSKLQTLNSKLPWVTKDFKNFYPTDVMETGYDILFFWVARMIMLGLYSTGQVPFRTVYLHGLVRDKDRQKMSKSKGNVIDPLGVAEIYGTDAVRMALTVGSLPGQDIIISEEKIRGYRNFANKIWNIHRFIMMKVTKVAKGTNGAKGANGTKVKYSAEDKKRLAELKALVKRVTLDIENFRFHHAAEALYRYAWHVFADKIIEAAKPRLNGGNPKDRAAAGALLLEIHSTLLKLLHPFMPFITEELWRDLPKAKSKKQKAKSLLMVEPWPTVSSF